MTIGFLEDLPPDQYAKALAIIRADPALSTWVRTTHGGLRTFRPRPDNPAEFDEQASFVFNRDPVSFFLKGNAAGGTTAAAYKTAMFLLRRQPPPRKDTPFWVISNTYEQVGGVCWGEKLSPDGMGFIPETDIDWKRVRWIDAKAGFPRTVPLKPWKNRPGRNWVLEFKSYEQGRMSMQARSIGGFWFSEQFPMDLFLEVLRGCRDTMYAGGQFAEFTPIEPELCVWLERLMQDPPHGWRFYRGNTACNRHNLAVGWFEQFFGSVPDEMLATRQTGALAIYEGVIYPSFNTAIHVVGDETITFPPNVTHFRSGDWGASEEHPHVNLWGYKDGMGDWYIYDEYWCADQSKVLFDHAVEVLARSIAWGWKAPEQIASEVYHEQDPILRVLAEQVFARVNELCPRGAKLRDDCHYGPTFADPARPGEIASFCRYGIVVSPANNDVYAGIDCVRTMLKPSPITGRPKLFIHKRCKHLIDEMRTYRWKRGRRVAPGQMITPEVAKPVPLKRHDDAADSLRYLLYSEARSSTGYTPGSMRHADFEKNHHGVQLDRRSGAGSSNGRRFNGIVH